MIVFLIIPVILLLATFLGNQLKHLYMVIRFKKEQQQKKGISQFPRVFQVPACLTFLNFQIVTLCNMMRPPGRGSREAYVIGCHYSPDSSIIKISCRVSTSAFYYISGIQDNPFLLLQKKNSALHNTQNTGVCNSVTKTLLLRLTLNRCFYLPF